MKNFRDYEDLIRNKVKELNDKDPNWKWSIKIFSSNRVSIKWSYLTYCGEKANCFFLYMMEPENDFGEVFITARTPQDDMIEGYFVVDETEKCWDTTWENGLVAAIERIADYAYSRY